MICRCGWPPARIHCASCRPPNRGWTGPFTGRGAQCWFRIPVKRIQACGSPSWGAGSGRSGTCRDPRKRFQKRAIARLNPAMTEVTATNAGKRNWYRGPTELGSTYAGAGSFAAKLSSTISKPAPVYARHCKSNVRPVDLTLTIVPKINTLLKFVNFPNDFLSWLLHSAPRKINERQGARNANVATCSKR